MLDTNVFCFYFLLELLVIQWSLLMVRKLLITYYCQFFSLSFVCPFLFFFETISNSLNLLEFDSFKNNSSCNIEWITWYSFYFIWGCFLPSLFYQKSSPLYFHHRCNWCFEKYEIFVMQCFWYLFFSVLQLNFILFF